MLVSLPLALTRQHKNNLNKPIICPGRCVSTHFESRCRWRIDARVGSVSTAVPPPGLILARYLLPRLNHTAKSVKTHLLAHRFLLVWAVILLVDRGN